LTVSVKQIPGDPRSSSYIILIIHLKYVHAG
jgi:hypothetical protein